MNRKKIYSLGILIMLVSTAFAVIMPSAMAGFHSVYGYIYIDDVIAPSGIEVKIDFDGVEDPDPATTDDTGFYDVSFQGHDWETGYFYVYHNGIWYVPTDNLSVDIEDEIGYPIDLHIETGNNPPYTPSNPNPGDGASDVGINTDLSWTGGDPDSGDTVTYDVYFGTNPTPDVLVSDDQPGTTYDQGEMSYSTQYYWQIIALDNHGALTSGPIWSFTTQGTGGDGDGDGDGDGEGDGDADGDGEAEGDGDGDGDNLPPIADASAGEPYQGFVGEEIEFDGSLSSDPEETELDYRWDFDGDGEWDTNWSTEATATHSYGEEGVYTVKLEVRDGGGLTNTDTATATIVTPNTLPTAPEVDGETTGMINTEYTYTAVSTDEDDDNISYTFDWGDDTTTTTDFLANGTSTEQTHTWTAAGTYTITVYATDSAGGSSGMTEHTITIEGEPEPEPEDEGEGEDYTALLILLIIIIIIIIGGYAYYLTKKGEAKKQEQAKKASQKKKSSKKSGKKK